MPRLEPFDFSGTVSCDKRLTNEQKFISKSV